MVGENVKVFGKIKKKKIICTKRKKLKKLLADNEKTSNQTLRRLDKHFGRSSFKKVLNEGIGIIY